MLFCHGKPVFPVLTAQVPLDDEIASGFQEDAYIFCRIIPGIKAEQQRFVGNLPAELYGLHYKKPSSCR